MKGDATRILTSCEDQGCRNVSYSAQISPDRNNPHDDTTVQGSTTVLYCNHHPATHPTARGYSAVRYTALHCNPTNDNLHNNS